ncbi:hypothetical protein BDV19DRAFT_261774 [Aspergillus venezuelensis]
MSTSSSSSLPAGVRAPLTADNEDDHSGLIVVLTSFYFVLTLASVSARVFSLYRKRVVQVDDYVFAGLVVIAFSQASVVLAQVHHGWGTRAGPRSSAGLNSMAKAGYAADILSIVALGLSKISTSLFYGSLFSQLKRWVIQTIFASALIWTTLSIFLVSIRCSSDPWYDITSSRCDGLLARWQTVTALDIVTEVFLIVYTAWAIHNVRIPFRKKVMVFLALGCRIVLIPLSSLRIHYLHTQLDSRTPTLLGAYATTTTEIYLSLSIVCQVTSSLKFIIAVYEDKDGISYTDGSARSGKNSKNSGGTGSSGSRSSGGKSRSRSLSFGTAHALPTFGFGGAFGNGHGKSESEDRSRLVGVGDGGEAGTGTAIGSSSGNGTGGAKTGTGVDASGSNPGGLKILRSVQWSVEDEAIELDDRGRTGEREVY